MTKQQILLMTAAYMHAMTGTGRAIRQGRKLPLSAVADNVGVAESTLSRWETGKRQPRGAAAVRWAQLLADLEAAA